MAPGETHGTGEVVDLSAGAGSGPLWGMASHDLNATLLAWPGGHAVADHVNDELDVLVVVLAGAILIPRGTRRAIRAGADGVRYLSVHRRRGPLQIAPRPAGP